MHTNYRVIFSFVLLVFYCTPAHAMRLQKQMPKNFCISYKNQFCYISYKKIKHSLDSVSWLSDHCIDLAKDGFSEDQFNEIFGFFVRYKHDDSNSIKKLSSTIIFFCETYAVTLA